MEITDLFSSIKYQHYINIATLLECDQYCGKSFIGIAQQFGFNEADINKCKMAKWTGKMPALKMLEMLNQQLPDLLIAEFQEKLIIMERYDVNSYVMNYILNCN